MRICHKFVKEYFIFVMAFTQIGAKQTLDESRSQFAVFATQYTSVIPYGLGSTKKLFYLTTNHKICIDRNRTFVLFHPVSGKILLHLHMHRGNFALFQQNLNLLHSQCFLRIYISGPEV